jgi:hypothetical protein
MVTVDVSAKLTVDDLVLAVEKLPTEELTHFVRRVVAIQTRRGAPLLVDEEEQTLLEAIKGQLPTLEAQERLDALRQKSREGALTPAEQAELLSFVQQVESRDLARAEALVTLARKRGTTVSALMSELNLEPTYA